VALFGLLLSYWPGLKKYLPKLHQIPADVKQLRENGELLVTAMQVRICLAPKNGANMLLRLMSIPTPNHTSAAILQTLYRHPSVCDMDLHRIYTCYSTNNLLEHNNQYV
jgi:hypothetical protein